MIETIDKKVEAIDKRLTKVETKLDDGITPRLDTLSEQIKEIKGSQMAQRKDIDWYSYYSRRWIFSFCRTVCV